MCSHPHETGLLPLPSTEGGKLTEDERCLLLALTRYFTPDQLTVLSDDDIEYFLSLESADLPDVPPDEAKRAAHFYRNRIQARLSK